MILGGATLSGPRYIWWNFVASSKERIEAVLRTNFLGAVWCVRALEPGLQPGSHVVNVVSVAGTVAHAQRPRTTAEMEAWLEQRHGRRLEDEYRGPWWARS